MATLNGANIGTVKRISRSKDAQLFRQPLPTSNSTSSIILDLFGVSGEVRVEGVYVASSLSDAKTLTDSLDAYLTGAQTRIAFVDDHSRTFNVYVGDMEWTQEEGAPLTVNWSMTLMEGA